MYQPVHWYALACKRHHSLCRSAVTWAVRSNLGRRLTSRCGRNCAAMLRESENGARCIQPNWPFFRTRLLASTRRQSGLQSAPKHHDQHSACLVAGQCLAGGAVLGAAVVDLNCRLGSVVRVMCGTFAAAANAEHFLMALSSNCLVCLSIYLHSLIVAAAFRPAFSLPLAISSHSLAKRFGSGPPPSTSNR